jgi:hypothetical protein
MAKACDPHLGATLVEHALKSVWVGARRVECLSTGRRTWKGIFHRFRRLWNLGKMNAFRLCS